MKHKNLISAILPTFNRCELLEERIKEIKKQTYDKWELIVINDCSTDKTEEILKKHESKKIKIINLPENSGCVSIPRSIGICQANGEYIAPIDDDVINLENKFKNLVKTINKKKSNVLSYGNRIEVWNRKDLPQDHWNWQKNSRNIFFKKNKIENWNPLLPNGWGVDNGQILYKTEVYRKIPIKFFKRACDWELCKMLKNLGDFAHLDEDVCIYMWHYGNRSLDESTKYKNIYPEKFKSFFENHNHNNINIIFNNL